MLAKAGDGPVTPAAREVVSTPMQRLLLLRHGKSDWSARFDHDRERPLAARGRRAAELVGRALSAAGWAPEHALSSPALRARSTYDLAAAAGGWRCAVEEDEVLYSGDAGEVLARLARLPASCATALAVGHQPLWSELVALLAGGGRHRMPTAAVAALGFELGGWSELAPGGGELRWLLPPKLLSRLSS